MTYFYLSSRKSFIGQQDRSNLKWTKSYRRRSFGKKRNIANSWTTSSSFSYQRQGYRDHIIPSCPFHSFLSDRMADPIPNRKNSISTQLSFFHLDLFIAPLLSFSLGLRLLIHCLSLPTCRLKVRSYHHLLTERFFTFFSLRWVKQPGVFAYMPSGKELEWRSWKAFPHKEAGGWGALLL